MRQPELGAATTPLGLDTNVPGPGETVKILFRSSEYLSLICMHEEEGTVEGGGAGTSVASTHNADGELALVELDEGKPSKMLAAGLASAKVGEPTALLHTPLLAPPAPTAFFSPGPLLRLDTHQGHPPQPEVMSKPQRANWREAPCRAPLAERHLNCVKRG